MPLPLMFLILIALVAGPGAASAQSLGLYEAETTTDSQTEADRVAALPRALAKVLVKVTGDAAATRDPVLAAGLGEAARMVRQYRYRQDVSAETGVPQVRLTLIARFDDVAVNELVARSGRTLWPSPRPEPLVWLVIDGGRGARLVGEAQAGAVSALSGRAAERGLKLQFPLVDAQDQRALSASAAWAQEVTAIRAASQRYGAAPLLVGRLQRRETTWTASWLLLGHEGELQRWTSTDPDAAVVLAAGADGAVGSLAQDYSQRVLSGPAGAYDIRIVGLTSAQDYARVLNYLQRLPIVLGARPGEAAGDALLVNVSLSTGIEGLVRLVEGAGTLRAMPAAADGTSVFRLEP